MAGEAIIEFTGNCGKDPELRFLPNGDAVANVNVAVTPRKFADGEWTDAGDTVWFRVTAWRERAEQVVEQATKGSRVFVKGKFSLGTYEKDGTTYTNAQVEADVIHVMPKRATTADKPQQQQSTTSSDEPPW
jgi:single-strand DNA-binding protein